MKPKYTGNHAKRTKLIIGWTNKYLATAQLLTEMRQDLDPDCSMQDAIRWAVYHEASRSGITQAQVDARAAELDAADKMKAGQK